MVGLAVGRGELIHNADPRADVFVLGALAELGQRHAVHCSAGYTEQGQRRRHLDRRRRAEAGAGRQGAGDQQVRAAQLETGFE